MTYLVDYYLKGCAEGGKLKITISAYYKEVGKDMVISVC